MSICLLLISDWRISVLHRLWQLLGEVGRRGRRFPLRAAQEGCDQVQIFQRIGPMNSMGRAIEGETVWSQIMGKSVLKE
jgi:hypothetical protein